MTIQTMSALEFNEDLVRAKREALEAPVVITDSGEPSHVLMSYEEFRKLTSVGLTGEEFVRNLMISEPVDLDDEEVAPIRLGLRSENH